MSILFLDFDGVLNSEEFAIRTKPVGIIGLDPLAVARLKRIVERTHCDIVVSSTWRFGRTVGALQSVLKYAGLGQLALNVVDKTPVYQTFMREGVMRVGTQGRDERGQEIAHWFRLNPGWVGQTYAILDDDNDFMHGQPLYQTRWKDGLLDEDVDCVVQMLGGDWKK